jgi:hypothetical protein
MEKSLGLEVCMVWDGSMEGWFMDRTVDKVGSGCYLLLPEGNAAELDVDGGGSDVCMSEGLCQAGVFGFGFSVSFLNIPVGACNYLAWAPYLGPNWEDSKTHMPTAFS